MPTFNTRVVTVDPVAADRHIIAEAAAIINAGGLVAFPTETVYGLGADALNPRALRQIYRVKERPADNPLILHLASRAQLPLVAREVPQLAYALIDAFWPGALTLVLPKSSSVPASATGGLATTAVRMPAHPVALALIGAADTPLAAPSANRSGRPSPTTAQHVLDDLHGRLPLILDGGATAIGVESTVLDVTRLPPVILRPGGVSQEAIEAVIGPLQERTDVTLHRRSPGTRYRHYSPRARVIVLEAASQEALSAAVAQALEQGHRIGCLLHQLQLPEAPASLEVIRVGGCVGDYAHALFAALRSLDTLGVDVILVESVAEVGIGVAVMDRLRRAAAARDR